MQCLNKGKNTELGSKGQRVLAQGLYIIILFYILGDLMGKHNLFLMAIFLLILATACIEIQQDESEDGLCKPPYIEFKEGECCLDKNSNQICDNDEEESVTVPEKQEIVEKQEIQETEIEQLEKEETEEIIPAEKPTGIIYELLEKVPNKYWYYTTYDGIGGIVYGTKRASGWVGLSRKLRLFYWDSNTKEVDVFYDEVAESRLLKVRNIDLHSTSRETFLAFIKQNITGDKYPKSPVDWMHEYADKTPIKVETSVQMLQADSIPYTSNLRLYFQNDDETITLMKFDKRYNVPLQVEKIFKESVMEHYNYRFDTVDKDLDFAAIRKEITEDRVTLPENHIFITIEEAEKIRREASNAGTDTVNPYERVRYVMELFQELPKSEKKATY